MTQTKSRSLWETARPCLKRSQCDDEVNHRRKEAVRPLLRRVLATAGQVLTTLCLWSIRAPRLWTTRSAAAGGTKVCPVPTAKGHSPPSPQSQPSGSTFLFEHPGSHHTACKSTLSREIHVLGPKYNKYLGPALHLEVQKSVALLLFLKYMITYFLGMYVYVHTDR